MADEPDLFERVGQEICDAFEAYAPVPAVLRTEAPQIARALADAGLLADPGVNQSAIWVLDRVRTALGTPDGRAVSVYAAEVAAELERLRTRLAAQENINQSWQEYKHRKKAERERLTAERDRAIAAFHNLRSRVVEVQQERDRAIKSANDRLCRIDDALSWLDEPGDATSEVQLAKIRSALEGQP